MYPSDKKEDDLNFKRVLQCFLALAMYPFGLKELSRHDFLSNAPFDRFSLAMYPSDPFFLKALFLSGFRQVSPGCGPFQLKGCVGKEPVVCLTHLAMNFSNAGTTEPAGDAFRAHVTWYDKGVLQAARGCGTYCRSTISGIKKAQKALP